jgi:2-keto-4-pentenoate hydratase
MDRTLIEEAASYLADARTRHRRIERLPPSCRPSSIAEAYAIQDAVTAKLGEIVGAFKATAPRTSDRTTNEESTSPDPSWLATEGVRAPIFQSTIYASTADIPVVKMPQCGVEGEIAFRFLYDLPARFQPYNQEEIAAAVDAYPAIEVVSSRFLDPDSGSFLEDLADCVGNGGFVYGAPVKDWREIALAQLKVTLSVNGEMAVEQIGGHPTGDLLAIVAAVVEMMRGTTGVKAGQFVTTGSFTGLRFLKPGDACKVEFEGLGAAHLSFSAA